MMAYIEKKNTRYMADNAESTKKKSFFDRCFFRNFNVRCKWLLQSGQAYPTVPLFLSFFPTQIGQEKDFSSLLGNFFQQFIQLLIKSLAYNSSQASSSFAGMRPVQSGTPHIHPYHKNCRKHISGNNLRNGNKYLETDTNGNLHP